MKLSNWFIGFRSRYPDKDGKIWSPPFRREETEDFILIETMQGVEFPFEGSRIPEHELTITFLLESTFYENRTF